MTSNLDVPEFSLNPEFGDVPMPSNLSPEMEVLRHLMEQLVISSNRQEELMKHLPTTTTSEARPEKELKVAPPEQFDGSPEKLRAFLISLELVFGANPSTYKSDRRKIYFALSYMQKGIAKQWVDTKVTESKAEKVKWSTYKDFEAAVRESFESANVAEDAQLAIENLVQGNSTAEVFFEYFETYKRDSGYNDVALIRFLKKNLDRRLLQAIYNQTPLPKTYDEWKKIAIQKDRQWREMRSNVGGGGGGGNRNPWFNNRGSSTGGRQNTSGVTGGQGGSHGNSGGSTTSTHDGGSHAPTTSGTFGGAGAPMDIDRTRGGSAGKFLCYNCDGEGHLARNCPKPRRPRQQPRAFIRNMFDNLSNNDKRELLNELGFPTNEE